VQNINFAPFDYQLINSIYSQILLTYKLFHFVSLIFIKYLIINKLSENLVSLVSSVSHFRETNIQKTTALMTNNQ